MLLGSGVHTVWAFWEIYSSTSWFETEVAITVAAWYVATAIGSAIAAVLVSKWSKRKLYVSRKSKCLDTSREKSEESNNKN